MRCSLPGMMPMFKPRFPWLDRISPVWDRHLGIHDSEAWGRPRDKEKYPEWAGFVEASLNLYYRYLNLGFRKDKFAIPTDLFKAQLAAVSREFLKQNEQERLTRMQREDLKKMVRNDLKRRTLPTTKVTDMSWNLTRNEVRFWSQSTKLCELFQASGVEFVAELRLAAENDP